MLDRNDQFFPVHRHANRDCEPYRSGPSRTWIKVKIRKHPSQLGQLMEPFNGPFARERGGVADETFARGRYIQRQSRAQRRLDRQLCLACASCVPPKTIKNIPLNDTGIIKFFSIIFVTLMISEGIHRHSRYLVQNLSRRFHLLLVVHTLAKSDCI
jgi:hypothetical protein